MHESKPTLSDEEREIGIELGQAVAKNIPVPPVRVQFNGKEISAAATDYKHWELEYCGFKLQNLQAFDSSTTCGITQDEEVSLIDKEIQKFIWFINRDKPPLFNSYGAFYNTLIDSYKDLYNIADQIMTNLAIIQHDNACLAFDHYVRHEFSKLFQETRKTLRNRYRQEPKGIVGHNPETLSGENRKRNMKAYHALVDYIFHSLAWWLMHVLERKSWCVSMIAVLARWTVKLKLLELDPVHWAEKSLARGENIMRKANEKCKDTERIGISIKTPDKDGDPEKVDTLENEDLDIYYYLSKTQVRITLRGIVDAVLTNLKAGNGRKGDFTAFEVYTVLYRNDLYRSLRQVTFQQNRCASTSSDTTELEYGFWALHLLQSNVASIPKADKDALEAATITLTWELKRENLKPKEKPKEKRIARLDDIVSMLVPIGLMSCVNNVKDLNRWSRWLSNQDDVNQNDILSPPRSGLNQKYNPRIEFLLRTRQGMSGRAPRSIGPLITSIKDLEVGLEIAEFKKDQEEPSHERELQEAAFEVFKEYTPRTEEAGHQWVWNEDSVLVRTKTYSYSTLGVAIAIIGGSLSVPFIVGEGIAGVDPFNFVTFGWLLAGAFLVGVKSIYVENWPWHDFLRGQIVCRSVSELADASKFTKQAVLLCLLHHEFQKPLLFCGPFRGPFQQRSDSSTGGFSINCAVEHTTMLAAGFIVLEARTAERNPHTNELNAYTLLHDTRESQTNLSPKKDLISGSVEHKKDENKEIRIEFDRVPPSLDIVGVFTESCKFI